MHFDVVNGISQVGEAGREVVYVSFLRKWKKNSVKCEP